MHFVNIFIFLQLPKNNKNKGKNIQKHTKKGIQNCPTEKK